MVEQEEKWKRAMSEAKDLLERELKWERADLAERLTEQEREQTKQERERADLAERLAEQERERADELAAELAELKQQFAS